LVRATVDTRGKTAKALGLDVLLTLQAIADQVAE
jgi:hypothetical protein